MSRRKPVVAWAVVFSDGVVEVFSSRAAALQRGGACSIMCERIAKLVEADPAADAVVRAARQLVAAPVGSATHRAFDVLERAVDRLEKKRRSVK